jgi:hypothetical protein
MRWTADATARADASAFVVKNPGWLKGLIVLGPVFLAGVAIYWGRQAYDEPLAALRAVEWGIVLFFAGFAAAGVRLLKFMNYELQVGQHSVTLRSPQESRSLGWADLRLRNRHVLHLTEMRDRDGKILFVVDWYATNARRLAQAGAQRIGKDA